MDQHRYDNDIVAAALEMDQDERRLYLIRFLLGEQADYAGLAIPADVEGQRRLLRGLFNVRPAWPASDEFIAVQDAYLQERTREKGITDLASLSPVEPGIYLWQGDITTLRCDGIVNAANSQMLGCWQPNHACIDNFIHTFAGIQLRAACFEQMQTQGHEEKTGLAKITPAFNLPSSFVLHTVGPIVNGPLTSRDEELLISCYTSCLELARQNGLKSLAFCCISTGVFGYPQREAAETAVRTVRGYRALHEDAPEVIFNVFKDVDLQLYRELLGG